MPHLQQQLLWPVATPVQSDTRDHSLKHKNKINIDNFDIIDRCLVNSELFILESLFQKTKKPSIGTLTQSTTLVMFD